MEKIKQLIETDYSQYRRIGLGERTALVLYKEGVYVVLGTVNSSQAETPRKSDIMPADTHQKSYLVDILTPHPVKRAHPLMVFCE